MALACPQCNSPIAREGQRFCYRCGNDLRSYYEAQGIEAAPSEPSPQAGAQHSTGQVAPEKGSPVSTGEIPNTAETMVMESYEITAAPALPDADSQQKALLRILLPSGDVFDRELSRVETQVGKGPRNDIVIADPAVSTSHAVVRVENGVYTIADLGSRNGTFVNGERISEPRRLNHGDVIGLGLSKLTFRLRDHSETGAIQLSDIAGAPKAPPPLAEDSIAAALVSEGLVSRSDMDRLRASLPNGQRLVRALLNRRMVGDEQLRDLLSHTFQIPSIDLRSTRIDEELATAFSSRIARDHHVFVAREDAGRLILAMLDPTDTVAVDRVKNESRKPVDVRIASFGEISEQIEKFYGPKLIGVLPTGEKLRYSITQHEVEIGKAAHNHIVISDPTVSNTHAVLIVRDGGYSIVDLGSRNGTFVNGERLGTHAHTLRHGDSIQLGQTVLTFRNSGETSENITATLSLEALEEVRRRAGIQSPSRVSTTGETPSPLAPSPVQPAAAPPAGFAGGPLGLAQAPPAPDAAEAEDESAEKKKKKKKKKEASGERLKAAYIGAVSRVLAQVFAVLMSVGLALYIATRNTSPTPPAPATDDSGSGGAGATGFSAGAAQTFAGKKYEASGVVSVPNTDGVLFIDDSTPDQIFWMQLDQSGNQVGGIQPIPLNLSVPNPEAITYDGSFYYVISSQSEPSAADQNALVRFAFDPVKKELIGQAEAIKDLRGLLLSNVPELGAEGGRAGIDGGINIEGVSWDPTNGRLLIALRSPLVGGQAVLVPVRFRNPREFTAENLIFSDPRAILLQLGGQGVRDIQYDGQLRSFLIISGALDTQRKTDFKLWQWSGSDQSKPAEGLTLSETIKPEGITRARVSGRSFVFVVGDANYYLRLDDRQ
jgi:pSer/pThr/pTyr-binding forkhead associated (FHA) protein